MSLCLKDEFTFQIPALEIFPKTRGGGHSSIIEDMDVRQGFSNHYPFADKWRKYIPYFLGLAPLLGLVPP